jgi:hypothetical protein
MADGQRRSTRMADFGGRRVPGVLRTARARNAVPADADDQPIIRNYR